MKETKTYPANFYNTFAIHLFRLFLKYVLPKTWFREPIPEKHTRKAVKGHLNLEVVSHCWQYGNMLNYQLSSYVNYPPKKLTVTATVFYNEDDTKTRETLSYFQKIEVENVIWNFQPMDKPKLFRRGIGRNTAARATQSDWIWFTDCDIIFHENCFDSLADALQGSQEVLHYPRQEYITELLSENDPMLSDSWEPSIIDVPIEQFILQSRKKARGPFQIVHSDIARAIGYCEKMSIFQTECGRWRKTYEDTAFRWLISSDGEPLDIENVFQIRHVTKGRYKENSEFSKLRSKVRQSQG